VNLALLVLSLELQASPDPRVILACLVSLVVLVVMLSVVWLDLLELQASLEQRVNLATLVLMEDPASLVTLAVPAHKDLPV